MSQYRQLVNHKHAFSYGICPFCNKEISDADTTNIEHVLPFNQIKEAYGNVNKKERLSLNFEREISVLCHKDCNSKDGEIEEAIGSILNKKLQKASSHTLQLDYNEITNIFKYGEKLIRFLPYIPSLRGKYNPKKQAPEYVRIFRTNLPLGLIVKQFPKGSAVLISFNGVGFLYGYDAGTSQGWSNSITIHKKDSDYICICRDEHNTKKTTIKQNKSLQCNDFYKMRPHVPYVKGAMFGLMHEKDALCVISQWIYNVEDQEIRKSLNLRALIRTGDVSSNVIKAMRMQKELQDRGIVDTEDILKSVYGKDIVNKIQWLSSVRKFKFPDDVTDIVVNMNGGLKIFQKDDFVNTSYLNKDYTITKDVLLVGEGLETLNDLSNCHVNGNVLLDNNNLHILDGAPSYVSGVFSCRQNRNLISLQGAPKYVGMDFCCMETSIGSLTGAPKRVDGSFFCMKNENLTSLEGGPKYVGGDFNCSETSIGSLEGGPEYVGGNFYCNGCKLINLKGAPKTIKGSFSFSAKHLESLDGLPNATYYVVYEGDAFGKFNSEEELREWFEYEKTEHKVDQKKTIKQAKFHRATKRLEHQYKGITTDRRMDAWDIIEECTVHSIRGATIDCSF